MCTAVRFIFMDTIFVFCFLFLESCMDTDVRFIFIEKCRQDEKGIL